MKRSLQAPASSCKFKFATALPGGSSFFRKKTSAIARVPLKMHARALFHFMATSNSSGRHPARLRISRVPAPFRGFSGCASIPRSSPPSAVRVAAPPLFRRLHAAHAQPLAAGNNYFVAGPTFRKSACL